MSAEERTTDTVPEWKREEVDELVDLLESYDSVGVVNVTGIPSKQLQDMRRGLHGSAVLRMSRNTLLVRALEEVDDGLEDLTQYITGEVGLVATNDNPFGLFQRLEESKTPAPINAGEVAPNDIVVPEGDTGIDPGPFVGELQQIGANARIQEGSIKVMEDSVVVEEGETVSTDVANVLAELGIEPKEVGLDLRGVYSEGVLFTPDELEIDVEEYRADIQSAAASARNLSVNAEYPTAQTAPTLIRKAQGEAKSLGLQASIESPDLADDLVSKADAQVRALAAQIDDEEALPEELRDVEAPAAAAEPDEDEDEESSDEQATESEADADDSDDDEDGGDGAEGLGEMFG
ncbi:50S ribosomal protein L10 [Halobacterium sp. CBA1126]|uniref:50S ribosomal protein L10 n=1 Tax=Halobacterium sp. CBA1126 TaxID=2668074 RepID=UPI0012FC3F51|nr:50S ribosomal protein L10 [Halobacterium sp. CBA1126]MUV61142.1 50S ribosomal protein L10 [Halobacterium sp. CBA1126]